MSDILKVYSGDQLYEMFKQYIVAKNVGLTDFNDGSKTKALIQSEADIISVVSMDLKEGLFQAIPISLYEGFGFTKKLASGSTGYIRPYRKPTMTIAYTGAGTDAKITITSTQISATCTGAPGDAFTRLFSASVKTSALVSYIDGLTNWSAVLIDDVDCNTLYQYAAVDVLLQSNYLNASGMDLMLATAASISVLAGYSVTIDSMQFTTTVNETIPAGSSGIQCPAKCMTTGVVGNIFAGAIDTINGKGSINSIVSGILAVKNDSSFSGGAEGETEEERKTRFILAVNALNAGTKNGIIAELEKITGVRSAEIRAGYPFRGMNTIIVDDGSGVISPALLLSLEKSLYGDPDDLANYPGKNAEGIGYDFVAPTIVAVSVVIQAYVLTTNRTPIADIEDAIQSAVEQYINTLKTGYDVILSECARLGRSSNAAIYDIAVTSPAANIPTATLDVARTGAGTTGTVTVTVSVRNL